MTAPAVAKKAKKAKTVSPSSGVEWVAFEAAGVAGVGHAAVAAHVIAAGLVPASHPASSPVEHITAPDVPPPAAVPHAVGQSVASTAAHVETSSQQSSAVHESSVPSAPMVQMMAVASTFKIPSPQSKSAVQLGGVSQQSSAVHTSPAHSIWLWMGFARPQSPKPWQLRAAAIVSPPNVLVEQKPQSFVVSPAALVSHSQ
jgi:hypothetical protein